MSNLRSTKAFFSTLQKAHYSSSNEKLSQEVLKSVRNVAEEKAKSEKLVNLLPYLQHKTIENNPQTSVTNSPSEGKRESDKTKSNDHAKVLGNKIVLCEKVIFPSDTSTAVNVARDPPQSLPAMIVARDKTPTMDLTNIMLPLNLHLSDKKNVLVDSVVQDLKLFYFKTSSAVDGWYLVAKTKGKSLFISAEEYMKQPGIVQDFLREQVSKKAIALYNPQQSALAKIDVNSIMEKLKQLIEDITANIKKMFENKEAKPSKEGKDEKKSGEKKSEEKAEKPEKKVEEGEKSKVAAQQ